MKHQSTARFEEVLIVLGSITLLLLALTTLDKTTSDSFNQITANALSSANISALREAPCNITLEADFNLVSFFCITLDVSTTNLLQNITNMESIFEYQEGASDPWKSYNPTLPSYVVQDLSSMSRKEGYWIQMSAPQQVVIAGGLRVPTSINLVSGWNLAGYPTNQTKNITVSLSSIYGNYTEVRGFNATTQTFLSHTPPATGGLIRTVSGQAYWIRANTTEVWVVD